MNLLTSFPSEPPKVEGETVAARLQSALGIISKLFWQIAELMSKLEFSSLNLILGGYFCCNIADRRLMCRSFGNAGTNIVGTNNEIPAK